MRLFRKETAVPIPKPAAPLKPPVVEGWSERELTSVYSAAQVRNLKQNECLFTDLQQTDSFYVLLNGAIRVSVKWEGHSGRAGTFRRGDCLAPLPKTPGLLYCAEASEPGTMIEITPAVLNHLPEKTQLSIYKASLETTSRINAYIRTVNGEVSAKNALISAYVAREHAKRCEPVQSEFVQGFLRKMPRMPAYAMDLAVKLLDEKASVQEIAEGIKSDPSVAAIVLRSVNSVQFSFPKKIETFYHACMILGLNNIYDLILREAIQSAMPDTEDTRRLHLHSCLISVLCYEIAAAAKDPQAQTATTLGLLHDIGKGVQVVMKKAHAEKADGIDAMPSSRLGAQLLLLWGLSERMSGIVEHQDYAEFTPPELLHPEQQRGVAILHVAHVLELMLAGKSPEPEQMIYTRDYMALLGLPQAAPAELLKNSILPNIMKNRQRLPVQIRKLFPR